MAKIKVLDNQITITRINDEDYISLTDMLKSKAGLNSYKLSVKGLVDLLLVIGVLSSFLSDYRFAQIVIRVEG